MYLAADIGGTNVAVARFTRAASGLQMQEVSHFRSAEYDGLEDIFKIFLRELGDTTDRVDGVGIGVAGPVLKGCAKLTNLSWMVKADDLSAFFEAPVYLINDLVAHGYGIPLVPAAGLRTLRHGVPVAGNQALIAAGTGLGEAILFWNGRHHEVSASEGSHTDFGPNNQDDLDLLRFLFQREDHVSWEKVVSGKDGFRNLYDFLTEQRDLQVPETLVRAVEGRQDIGAQITAGAREGVPIAETIVRWFARLYGAEAGNLALKALAVGGVYVSGGIAPRILPWLEEEGFLNAFVAKGRFKALLTQIPVHVILDKHVALKGAARYALMRSEM